MFLWPLKPLGDLSFSIYCMLTIWVYSSWVSPWRIWWTVGHFLLEEKQEVTHDTCQEAEGYTCLVLQLSIFEVARPQAHQSKISWRNERENVIIQIKKKKKGKVLFSGSKHLSINIRCSHKTTICVSDFVPSKRPLIIKSSDMVHHSHIKLCCHRSLKA